MEAVASDPLIKYAETTVAEKPPAGADREELTLYLSLIRRADVDPATAPKIIADLEAAIEKRGPG